MICTGVIPYLFSGLAKITNLCPYLSYFPGFFGHFVSLAFLKMGEQTLHQSSQTGCFKSIFQRYSS